VLPTKCHSTKKERGQLQYCGVRKWDKEEREKY